MPKISSRSLPAQTSQNGNEMSEMFFNIGNVRVKSGGMDMQGISYHKLVALIGGTSPNSVFAVRYACPNA